jgi:colanic acid biosynthesis glycosyl transferase WcaI
MQGSKEGLTTFSFLPLCEIRLDTCPLFVARKKLLMKLLLLNQFGPVSSAPTGRILADLGAYLEKQGCEVILLSCGEAYGKPLRGVGRLWKEACAHLSLLWHSLWVRRVDAVISLTSPACLPVTCALIAGLHRARHLHWAMDLYPDVAVRLGEMKNPWAAAFFRGLMRLAYQSADRVISLDEDMRDYLRTHYGVESVVVEPTAPEMEWPVGSGAGGIRWLYSGNFGRAHDIQVLMSAQRLIEESGLEADLILQGHGAQFESSRLMAAALGLRRVGWRDPVPMATLGQSLLGADVLVVTRKPDMKGILLPSKLILAELSGRRVLWIGDVDGKTAARLARNGHGVFAPDDIEGIASWLQAVFRQDAVVRRPPPSSARERRDEGHRRWAGLLGLTPSPDS